MESYCTEYADRILDGDVVAGRFGRAAAKRHLDDLGRQSAGGLIFDQEAEIAFYEDISKLTVPTGVMAEQPFELLPSQKFICGSLFGWHKWSDEFQEYRRRFRSGHIRTGKGIGKTPLAAAIALYLLLGDDQPQPKIYILARLMEQAKPILDNAVIMRDRSEWLREATLPYGGVNPLKLISLKDRGEITRVASDRVGAGHSGPRASAVIHDEYQEAESSTTFDYYSKKPKHTQHLSLIHISEPTRPY